MLRLPATWWDCSHGKGSPVLILPYVQAPVFTPDLGASAHADLPESVRPAEPQPAHFQSLEEMQEVLLDEQQPSLHDWAAVGPAVGVTQGLPESAVPWQKLDPHSFPGRQVSTVLQCTTAGSLLQA